MELVVSAPTLLLFVWGTIGESILSMRADHFAQQKRSAGDLTAVTE